MKKIALIAGFFIWISLVAQNQPKLARLHYDGGGDWYNNTDIIPNLVAYINPLLKTDFASQQEVVRASDAKLFAHPFLFMTGHGNVKFSSKEQQNLRDYLNRGGFLLIDDDYGMDESIRQELRSLFPNKNLTELPANHELFHCYFEFQNGLPKIHKHDDKRPQAFALFDETGRIMVLYLFESNITDGWSDMHNDPIEIRTKALEFGANLMYFLITKN